MIGGRLTRALAAAGLTLLIAAPSTAGAQTPVTVRVGAYINDVQQLDLQTHSYTVDMYLWFEWCDDSIDPSRTLEFLNSYELWGHILTHETEEPEKRADGCFYQALRNQGKFNTRLPLADYPFDTQRLAVEFEDSAADISGLRYVPDTDPIARNPQMTLPGYDSAHRRSRSSSSRTRPGSGRRARERSPPTPAHESRSPSPAQQGPTRRSSCCRSSSSSSRPG